MGKVGKYTVENRVRGTDFIVGHDKDGNVKRFRGNFFLRSLANDSAYLAMLDDEVEARIAGDALLDDKIDLTKINIEALISGLEGDITTIQEDLMSVDGKIQGLATQFNNELYGPGGITESYTSAITQTAEAITMSVDEKLYGPDGIQQQYTSAIQQYSDQIISTVNGTLNDFENEVYTEVGSIIQQSATDILLQVDGKIVDVKSEITTEYTSAITVVKDEIALAVSGQMSTLEGEITSAYESAINISEGQILSTVGAQITGLDGRIASNTSSITQLSDSIDLSVFTNGVLDAGILIGKINDNTSGVRITGKSILLDGDVEITGTAFAENIYASGATLGGFTINETSLQLGTQAAWNPSSGTDGLLMGIDPLDSKYKFYLGDVDNHLIWNGENLIISGFALIGDGTSTTTLNDLGKLGRFFEIVNEGQANEYLKLLAPLAVTGEVQAWASDPNVFPPNIWSSLPLASDTTLGAVRIGEGLKYDAVTGRISVDGSAGAGFDESANYSPSGTWAFSGSVSVGGSPVATQTQLNGKANKNGSSAEDFTVKNLTVHGTVNHWLADVITVADARLQLNRTQEGATVASGLDIYNGTNVVSSLLYDTSGVWRAGGQRIYTDDYHPLADSATNALSLGGYSAASYPRKAEVAVITGWWNFQGASPRLYIEDTTQQKKIGFANSGSSLLLSRYAFGTNTHQATLLNIKIDAPTNSFRIESNGNVGLGVTATERLHVAGNGLFTGNVTAGGDITVGSTGRLILRQSNTYLTGGGHCTLRANGIEYWRAEGTSNIFRIYQNTIVEGNITANRFIGTNDTSNTEVAAGDAKFDGYGVLGNRATLFFTNGGSDIRFCTNANIHSAGDLPLRLSGLNAIFGGNITASGNITAQGEVTAYLSSDSRLKQNIKPITSALDIIEGLNPVSYNWNKKAIALNSIKDDIRTNYGVIAQEVEKILPDLVHQTNGYKSVDYIQMIGILLAGVRELNCRINNLENR